MPKATPRKTAIKVEQESDWGLLNKKTGEFKPVREGSIIIPPEKNEAYQRAKNKQKNRAMDVKKRGLFVQVIHTKDREIEKELSLKQASVLLDLFFCVTNKSKNYLVHTAGKREGQKMNVTDISLYLGKSERQTRRDLGELVNLGVLICEKNSKMRRENFYLLNDKFLTTTKRKGPKVKFTKMFHNKLKEVRSKLTNNQYGALLKLIRCFHYQTYYLVANPDYDVMLKPELNIFDNLLLYDNKYALQHLNQRQIAEIIGVTEDGVRSFIKAYAKAGAIMILDQYKSYRFMIHPDLMFRKDDQGEDDYTKSIRFHFSQFKEEMNKKAKKEALINASFLL